MLKPMDNYDPNEEKFEVPSFDENADEEPEIGFIMPEEQRTNWVVWFLAGLAAVLLGFIIWWYLPLMQKWTRSFQEPTPFSQTITPIPTRTLRPTATATIPLPPTPTAMPVSAFQVVDPSLLNPPLAGLPSLPIVLNEDRALVNPELSHPQWIPSSKIAEQLGGIELPEPYYATFGAAAVSWVMDVPLAVGMYEIYVMDTVYSSAGPLDFKVRLGAAELKPVLGQATVDFLSSSRGDVRQSIDLWRSIGVYSFENNTDLLSVSAEWGPRDEYTIAAVDRVLIVALPASTKHLVSPLPPDKLKYIVDDITAEIDSVDILLPVDDSLSWFDEFQVVTNPNKDVKVVWKLTESVPLGKYEVLVWIPAKHNKAGVTYRVLANDVELEGDPALVNQVDYPGSWVSIGLWDVSSLLYGKSVRLSVRLDVKGGTLGDIAIDSVAFVKAE
jgi:hypothetical protein